MSIVGHTRSSWMPATFSMMIYSAPTGFSALELQAYTLGAGVLNMLRTCDHTCQISIGKGDRATYKIHSCNLTSSSKMRTSGVWVWNFANNLSSIVHCEEEGFIEHSIRVLFNFRTGFRTHSLCSNPTQCIHIEWNVTLRHFKRLISNETTSREAKICFNCVPIWASFRC